MLKCIFIFQIGGIEKVRFQKVLLSVQKYCCLLAAQGKLSFTEEQKKELSRMEPRLDPKTASVW